MRIRRCFGERIGQNNRPKLSDEAGLSTVEFAICLPIVLIIASSVFLFAQYIGYQNACESAVAGAIREGITLDWSDEVESTQYLQDYAKSLLSSDKQDDLSLDINIDNDTQLLHIAGELSLENSALNWLAPSVKSQLVGHIEQ